MEILPSTDVNFQALADNITSDFFSKGIPLGDGCVKVAQEQKFTPQEVTRLVEKTNTAASIHLLKTAEDKKGTFTLAHVDLVLQRTHPAADDRVEKTASYKGLPVTAKSKNTDIPLDVMFPAKAIEKTASVKEDPITLRTIFALEKAYDEKGLQKVATERKVQYQLDYLCSEFNRWNGPDFEKFASECDAVFGVKSQAVLEGMAKYLDTSMPTEKLASDYVIDDTDKYIKSMSSICDGLQTIVKLADEMDEIAKAKEFFFDGMKKAAKGSN